MTERVLHIAVNSWPQREKKKGPKNRSSTDSISHNEIVNKEIYILVVETQKSDDSQRYRSQSPMRYES